MAGRFTTRVAPASEAPDPPSPEPQVMSGSVLPEMPPEQAPSVQADNPLLSAKLLDAKVRLHRKLIEEINLSALDKLPEDEIRKHVQQLVSQSILVERLPPH